MTYAVIMAGGSGTRFWPVSRQAHPKQLAAILGETTMIQATVARLMPLIPAERILIVTTQALAGPTRAQLPMLAPDAVIAEPYGRDTAAAVALAAMVVRARDPAAAMILLPADQLISPAAAFQRALQAGIDAAQEGALVTFGIPPRHAATGYGYIKTAGALPERHGCRMQRVLRFVEKPDAATAAGYLKDGGYLWNSGIFCWKPAVCLEQLAQHCPWLVQGLAGVVPAIGTEGFAEALDKAYAPLKRISIDYALMEKAVGVQVVVGDFQWDDVGAWDSLYDHTPSDPAGVRVRGDVVAVGCRDSLLVNHGRAVLAATGLSGITVVATEDAILVLPKGAAQDVKRIVDRLKSEGRDALL